MSESWKCVCVCVWPPLWEAAHGPTALFWAPDSAVPCLLELWSLSTGSLHSVVPSLCLAEWPQCTQAHFFQKDGSVTSSTGCRGGDVSQHRASTSVSGDPKISRVSLCFSS